MLTRTFRAVIVSRSGPLPTMSVCDRAAAGVARLAAEGLTNSEIAARLFTQRTMGAGCIATYGCWSLSVWRITERRAILSGSTFEE